MSILPPIAMAPTGFLTTPESLVRARPLCGLMVYGLVALHDLPPRERARNLLERFGHDEFSWALEELRARAMVDESLTLTGPGRRAIAALQRAGFEAPPRSLFTISERPARADEQIVAAARAGSQAAWSELFERYQPIVRSAVQRATSEAGSVNLLSPADLEMEVWAEFISNTSRRDIDDGRVPATLREMAKRAVDRSDDIERGRPRPVPDEVLDRPITDPDPDERTLPAQILELVPRGCEQLLILRYLDQLPIVEIAAAVGMPPEVALIRLRRCLRTLRRRLGDAAQDAATGPG